jgi:hypothetical protein
MGCSRPRVRARFWLAGRMARPGLSCSRRTQFEHDADGSAGIVVSGEEGLEDAAQLVDRLVLADGSGQQFALDLADPGTVQCGIKGSADRLHGNSYLSQYWVWIAANAFQQVIGLVDIGNHPDVSVVFMACMDCRSYIGTVIAGGKHPLLYRLAKVFGGSVLAAGQLHDLALVDERPLSYSDL